MIKVSIHQPHYLPWAPLIYKIMMSDIYIVLDDVEYSKGEFQNRNYLYDFNADRLILLTVPMAKESVNTLLNKKKIAGDKWKQKHMKTINQLYSNEPFYHDIINIFDKLFTMTSPTLGDLNYDMLQMILSYLEINCEVRRSSTLLSTNKKTKRIIDLIHSVNGNVYLTTKNSINEYLEVDLLKNNKIKSGIVTYNCSNKEDYCSIISLIAHYGKSTKKIIERKGKIHV